jgi:hypothetical protein
MRYCDFSDSLNESLANDREDESCNLIRTGRMSDEMLTLVGEVENELDQDLADECFYDYDDAA